MTGSANASGKQKSARAMRFGAACCLLGLWGSAPVAAQERPAGPIAVAASERPRDLSQYKEEPVPGGALLVVAYGVIWLLVAGFVGRLAMRQSKLEGELRALQERMDGTPPPGGGS